MHNMTEANYKVLKKNPVANGGIPNGQTSHDPC